MTTPKKEFSSLEAYINLIVFIWSNGYVFHRFDRWLNSDIYSDTVNEGLFETLQKFNELIYASTEVRNHRNTQLK